MNRVTLFVGEFGSGKTELAMNYALHLKEQGYKTAIVDLDVAKPYFRTRENSESLEAQGLKVVAPERRLSNSDLPILPPELSRVLSDDTYYVVIDIGGGEAAVVLGQFRHKLFDLHPEILMVVNTRRPFTSSREGIISTLNRIETASGLSITGFISNTNIGLETSAEHVNEGIQLTAAVAQELSLPLVMAVVPEWLDGKVQLEVPTFILRPCTRYPWME